MSLQVANRVKETSTTTGTGTLDLGGAATGFQTFVDGIGDGNTCYYLITNGTDWEVGLGTVTSGAPDTLSRGTVLASSNGGAKVNWGAGTRDVACVYPAEKAVFKDSNGNLLLGTTTAAQVPGTLDILGAPCIVLTTTLANPGLTFGAIQGRHYTKSENNVQMLSHRSDSGSTRLLHGGGIAGGNAVTEQAFYTGSTTTTLVGTEVARITNSANNLINDTKIGGSVGDTPPARLAVETGSTVIAVFESTGSGAGASAVQLRKSSSSPADNDFGVEIDFRGNTDNGAGGVATSNYLYGRILPRFIDTSDGTEDCFIRVDTSVGGSLTDKFNIGQGAWMSVATGGDPGAGKFNASGYEIDGSDLGQQIARAWVEIDGTGTLAVSDSFNVSSVDDDSTGDYGINFSTAFANANYAAVMSADNASGGADTMHIAGVQSKSTTACEILVVLNGDDSASNVLADADPVSCVFFGDQ